MLQDIFPHQFKIEFTPSAPKNADLVLVYAKDKVLLKKDGETPAIPNYCQFKKDFNLKDELIYLFAIDETAFFLHQAEAKEAYEQKGYAFYEPQTFLYSTTLDWLAFGGITAAQLSRWYAQHKYCGCCATPFVQSQKERSLVCPKCNHIEYPKISPAVIVAVINGDEILLTRYKGRPFRNYALIAGFSEVGETLETTAKREVLEETGVKIKNLRYYKSQPWSLSDTLLAGFFAELEGSNQIKLDEEELSEGIWMKLEDLEPQNVNLSLTANMIEKFRLGKIN